MWRFLQYILLFFGCTCLVLSGILGTLMSQIPDLQTTDKVITLVQLIIIGGVFITVSKGKIEEKRND